MYPWGPQARGPPLYPRSYAQYTLLERLATGGMSEVDLARRTVEETGYVRFLVVKRIRASHAMDESFVRMFKDEARITSELRHTHIAQVYDFGKVDDEYYLALEYVAGTDVRAVLRKLREARKRMPVRIALRVASDVLDALHYAHTRTDARGRPMEVVHRDVNPRNIMISASGEVKLIDFGVARATDRLERTQTDHFKGKVAYMAPEQVTGDGIDHRADVFAMGLTLYELLTGKGVFAGLDQTQILYRLLQGQVPELKVPKEWGAPGRSLAALVNKALKVKADQRFATAADMREAVARVAADFGGLPTLSELRAWLQEVDPQLESRIHDKLERLSGPLAAPDGELPPTPDGTSESTLSQGPVPEPPPPSDSSVTLGQSGTFNRPVAVAAAGLGTVTVLAVGLVAILLVLVVVAGGIGISVGLQNTGGAVAAGMQEGDPTLVDNTDASTSTASGESGSEVDDEPVAPLQLGVVGGRDPNDETPPELLTPASPRVRSPRNTPTTVEPTTNEDLTTPDERPAGEASDDPEGSTSPEGSADATPEAVSRTPPETVSTKTEPPQPRAMGQLQVTAARKGLVIYIDGKPTAHRTGDEFGWPEGTYTLSAEGFAPRTVVVRPGLLGFVALKPE